MQSECDVQKKICHLRAKGLSKLFMVVSLSKMLVLVTFHILCNAKLVLCMIKIVMFGNKE